MLLFKLLYVVSRLLNSVSISDKWKTFFLFISINIYKMRIYNYNSMRYSSLFKLYRIIPRINFFIFFLNIIFLQYM